jgi:hypothetical protein
MKAVRITIALAIVFIQFPAFGQSPVQQFIANYISKSSSTSTNTSYPTNPGSFSSCTSNLYTYTWNNGTDNLLQINSFNVNSKTLVISDLDSAIIKLKRVNNANVTGIRNILYSESVTSPVSSCITPRQLDFKAPYNDDMTVFLNNRVLNQGTDNLFTNASNADGNNNNIERVDAIFKNGLSASTGTDAGFLFCERGNTLAHDGFRIAAILSIDVNNDPTSFGAVKTCVKGNGTNNGSWGHPAVVDGNKLLSVYVLRKDAAETYLRVSANVSQEIGGVFFSLSDLGIAANQVFYGYSLIGPDGTANPTSSQLLNINDAAVYPTGTTEAQGGGIDLIAVNNFFATALVLAADLSATISAKKQAHDVLLQWEILNLYEEATVALERSDNGVLFTGIYDYKIKNDGKNSFSDKPTPDIYFYRLKIKLKSGKVIYSRVILVNMVKHTNWKVFPSFIHAGESITLQGLPDGMYEVRINGMNSLITKTAVKIERGRGIVQLKTPQWPAGIYILSVNKNGEWVGNGNKIVFLNK